MYYTQINKNFVHQVGDQPRLYYDARSTIHKKLTFFMMISERVLCEYTYFLVTETHMRTRARTRTHARARTHTINIWIGQYTHRRTQLCNQMFVGSFGTFSCWLVQYDLLVPCSQDLSTSPIPPLHHQCHLHVHKAFLQSFSYLTCTHVTGTTIPNGPICHMHLRKRAVL